MFAGIRIFIEKLKNMVKKVIRLTEMELSNLIKEATRTVINEMDGATYSRIYNASHKAKEDSQNGNHSTLRIINNKTDGSRRFVGVNNDDTIAKARRMEKDVQPYWLQDYVGKTFKFYGEDRLGLVANVLFTFEKVTKLDLNKTILVGTVTFNLTQISGDGIIIDFVKNRVLYHEKGNKYAYKLEIDNRTAQLWNGLLVQLKKSLENRKEQHG